MTQDDRATSQRSAKPASRGGVPLAAVALFAFLLVTGTVGVVLGLVVPTLRAGGVAATKARAAEGLAKVYRALAAYAQAHEGQLPESHAVLAQRLVPTYIDALPAGAQGDASFYYVPLVNLRTVDAPDVQIILFEKPGLYPTAGGSIVTADGTITYVDGLKFDDRVRVLIPPGEAK
jgi:hypothetical protein